MKTTNYLLLTMVSVVIGCSTTPTSDAPLSVQDRHAFERMKYADPALGEIPQDIRSLELEFSRSLPNSSSLGKNAEAIQEFGSFNQVGPYNVGGRTRAFALDVNDPDHMLAGGVSGGLWSSHDGGATWTLKTAPHELHNVTAIAQDRREGHTNTWYYGTGEVWGNSARISGNGIWKSEDNGETWQQLPSTASPRIPASHGFAYIWRLAIDPSSDSNVVFAATTNNGILRSNDGGLTWSTSLSSNGVFSDIVVNDDGVFYAALSSYTGSQQLPSRYGVFRSTNGINWVDISPPNLPTNFRRAVIGLVPGDDRFFIIAETPSQGTRSYSPRRTGDLYEWHSLWMYTYVGGNGTNNGGLWEDRSANIPLLGGRNGDFFSQSGYDLFVRTSPHDTNLVIIGGTNLYRSTDAFRTQPTEPWIGGYNWPSQTVIFPSYPGSHPDMHELIFHPTDPTKVFNTNDGGIMVTNDIYRDTVVWSELNHGYYTTQFYTIAIRDTAGDEHVIGGTQDNGTWEGRSLNATEPWTVRNGGDGAYCQYTNGGLNIYASTQQGRITRIVLDENGTVLGRTRIDPAGVSPRDYLFINPFIIDYNDEKIMYLAAGSLLWRNNDLTQIPLGSTDSTSINWDSLPQTRFSAGSTISAVSCSRIPAHIVYYGTNGGKVFRLDDANIGMPVPKDISKGLVGGAYVNCITVDRTNADHVIVVLSNYGVLSIHESFDGGNTWEAISGNLEQNRDGTGYGPAVNWVQIVPFDQDKELLVAATSTGLYFTPQRNGMSTVWTQLASEEIGNVPIDMLAARYSDGMVFVGTHGRGVFAGNITSLPPSAGIPQLLTPAQAESGLSPEKVTFSWRSVPGAVSYQVEVSTDPTFNGPRTVYQGIQDTAFTGSDFEAGLVNYYWRVAAFAGGGKGEYSEVRYFRTFIGSPTAISPPDRTEGVPGLPVTLQWTRVEGALSYDIEVSTNLAFNGLTYAAKNITDTTADVPLLSSGTRYFWHARAVDSDTSGYWSQRSQFTTGVLTTVDEAQTLPWSVSPTPARDNVRITALNATGVIEVIDVDGRIVMTIPVESTDFQVDIRRLAAGTYTIRHRDESAITTRSIQIVR